jgi:RNA polymerase sigma-70 factor (ECF subfamily)
VFVGLHARLRGLESPEHVKFWLRRTTTHRCIDYARKHQRRRLEVPLEGLPEPAAAAAEAQDPFLSGRLQLLVASLPEKARAMVILRYQEGMEHGEIADVLSMPVNSVRSGLHRALALLREKMERTMGEGT